MPPEQIAAADKITNHFQHVRYLPITHTPVVILFCGGLDGIANGILKANRELGTSFKIQLAIDNSAEALELHRAQYPTIPVVQHTLGKSMEQTRQLIANYLDPDEVARAYFHASPPCVHSSRANMVHHDVDEGIRITKWSVRLLKALRPWRWTLEQEPSLEPACRCLRVHSQIVEMTKLVPTLLSDRRRLILSNYPLPFTPNSQPPISSVRDVLHPLMGLPDRISIVRTSFHNTRDTRMVGPTITCHGYHIGEHRADMKPVPAEAHLPLLTYYSPPQFPDDWSRGRKMRHICCMVPPAFAALMAVHVHNSASAGDLYAFFSPSIAPGIVTPKASPGRLLKIAPTRLQPSTDPQAYVDVFEKEIYWYGHSQVTPVQALPRSLPLPLDPLAPPFTPSMPRSASLPTRGGPTTSTAATMGTSKASEGMDGTPDRSEGMESESRRVEQPPIAPPAEPPPSHPPPDDPPDYSRFSYLKKYKDAVPWLDAKQDEYGNPLPLQPPHIAHNEALRVETPTPQQLDEAMKTLKVNENEYLNQSEREMMRHMVSYCWSLFDGKMRGIDAPPVDLHFSDPAQAPVKLPPYRLSPVKLRCLEKQLQEWMRDGVIRAAKSPWSFPALMLEKKGATPGTSDAYRTAIDFRQLNALLKDDSFPTTHTDDVFAFLGNGKNGAKRYRSTIDARWGFHLLSISDAPVIMGVNPDTGQPILAPYSSSDVCTFSTPLGCYSFKRLPLGLKPASAWFNRQLTTDLSEFLYRDLVTYIDDVTMAHDSKHAHLSAVMKILKLMAEKGYSVKLSKFKLLQTEIEILGHVSTEEGMAPSPRSVDALTRMKIPGTDPGTDPKGQLRSFLGLASWCRRYIKDFAKVVDPLRKLTESEVAFHWSPECQDAWDTVIAAVTQSKGLYHPDWTKPFFLRTDASKDGLGAYLFYMHEYVDDKGKRQSEERVISYWSRSVPKACRQCDIVSKWFFWEGPRPVRGRHLRLVPQQLGP